MKKFKKIDGSHRDPSGYVYKCNGSIYRTINNVSKVDYEFLLNNKVYENSINNGYLIRTKEISCDLANPKIFGDNVEHVLSHDLIPYISWPYEWSFSQLKAAALHHLDFHLYLLSIGADLKDSSAYNIQFIGKKPIFIDFLSIIPYKDGGYWLGYAQFCEQFLNPLLLRSKLGVSHNSYYKGSLEGIPTSDISRLLNFKNFFSPSVFLHVFLNAKMQKNFKNKESKRIENKFKLKSYVNLLSSLRDYIAKLSPLIDEKTTWLDYNISHTYKIESFQEKKAIVSSFCNKHKPKMLFDLGCNIGYFSKIALSNGCKYVVGFDFDQGAIDFAYNNINKDESFLPLFLDAINPSSCQGWRECERDGFSSRANADAVIALAFVHHICIAKNKPIDEVISWIVSVAPVGIIEFVPKDDPVIAIMLNNRNDIFVDYTYEYFVDSIEKYAKIMKINKLPSSRRVIIEFQR